MNYEFYKENYSGKNIKIAVIDAGVIDEVVNCADHYRVDNDGIVSKSSNLNLLDLHGTYCAQEITKIAYNANIYDINVADEKHFISEKKLIAALKYAVQLRVDIISISMKLVGFSEELSTVVEEIYKAGIFIVASSDGNVAYPADFKYVISVKSDTTRKDQIIHLSKKSVSIGKSDYTYVINNKTIKLEPSGSLACAYYAGILALVLEGCILASFNNICEKLDFFNYIDIKPIEHKKFIEKNTVVIDTSHNIKFYKNFRNLIIDEVIGFYDTKQECFLSLDDEIIDYKEIEHIVEINSESFIKQPIASQAKFKGIPYELIGDFIGINSKGKMSEFEIPETEFIKYINQPVIYIASFSNGSQKFETLANIKKQFNTLDVNTSAITCNPVGSIFGFSTYMYPREITFPSIVYKLNETLSVTSQNQKTDILIADIPGGITKLNWHNENNFGMLFKAFLMAADADIIIIMLNEGVLWEDIKKEVQSIELMGVPNIIFCVSELAFDMSTAESETGIQMFNNGIERNNLFYLEALNHLSKYKVFSYNEMQEGKLVEYIISLYQ